MSFRSQYRRKAPSSPEVQGLFFKKAQLTSAFFNPSRQSGSASINSATLVVQQQEGAIASAKPEEETPVQKQDSPNAPQPGKEKR